MSPLHATQLAYYWVEYAMHYISVDVKSVDHNTLLCILIFLLCLHSKEYRILYTIEGKCEFWVGVKNRHQNDTHSLAPDSSSGRRVCRFRGLLQNLWWRNPDQTLQQTCTCEWRSGLYRRRDQSLQPRQMSSRCGMECLRWRLVLCVLEVI